MRIAVVGPGGAGKDVLSEYLAQKYEAVHVSSSDIIRSYIIENNLGDTDRITLRRVGKEVRDNFGPDFLVRKAVAMHGEHIILSGLRTVTEVESFKSFGAIIVGVTAPLELRYERLQSRTDGDIAMTFELFQDRDRIESSNSDPNAQNISAVMALADIVLNNVGDKQALFTACDDAILSAYEHNR